jgi:hypothetical protein
LETLRNDSEFLFLHPLYSINLGEASTFNGRGNARFAKILTLEKEWFAGHFGESVGETIAKV